MNKKIIIGLIIIAIAIITFLAYVSDENIDISNQGKIRLNVSSEGPVSLSKLVREIETKEYFKGYDNGTVEWMKSLNNKYVFFSSDEYVIMNKWDADKIPSAYVCDASFYEIFEADLIENHSLGSGGNLKDVLYVRNVEFIRQDVVYYEV